MKRASMQICNAFLLEADDRLRQVLTLPEFFGENKRIASDDILI